MKVNLSKVVPSHGLCSGWRNIVVVDDADSIKAGWKHLAKFTDQADRGAFKKWWSQRGVYDYARWLWKNKRAWAHEDREGFMVVTWATPPGKQYVSRRKRRK